MLDELLTKSPDEPRLLLERASAWASAGEREKALRALARVTAPAANADQRRRAALKRQELKDPGALAALEALSKELPDDASLLADVGLARWLAGRGDAAVEALKSAIRKDPRALPAYLTLGAIYGARGLFAEEAALYESAPRAGADARLLSLLSSSEAAARGKISR
ncbi:MAG: hypothetical protein M0D55_04290 [Elusimicrobiota bacterium]|nr:MAG: hypothetical protein M0D55_04290 [Elusimicrobiota bacterium]